MPESLRLISNHLKPDFSGINTPVNNLFYHMRSGSVTCTADFPPHTKIAVWEIPYSWPYKNNRQLVADRLFSGKKLHHKPSQADTRKSPGIGLTILIFLKKLFNQRRNLFKI